jgi:S-adenosylmethionine hydrolase
VPSKTVISLLTDFGLRDPYVAEMKAVILSICPEARIVDISHDIEKYNVRMGAFLLAQAAPYFPRGTVHVVVVDPGVGTKRRPIIIEARRSLYVGPDNGVLMLSAQNEGIKHIHEITNEKYMLKPVSRTFHGRDIFSPAAAYLANGVSASDFGPEVHDPLVPSFASLIVRKDEIRGEIIHIDGFGNLITNITKEQLSIIGIKEGGNFQAALKGTILDLKICSAYGDVPAKTPLAIIGGTGFLELSVNQGDAAQAFKAHVGDKIIIKGQR